MPKNSKQPSTGNLMSVYLTESPTFVAGTTTILPSEVEKKISSFANLPIGWDYGSGGPIPEDAIETALAWNRFMQSRGLLETDAFPGGDGEVVIAAGYGDHYFEIIVEPDFTISLAYDCANKQMLYRSKLGSADAQREFLELMGQINPWNTFAYSTPANSIGSGTGLLAQHSGTLQPTDIYPSSGLTVFTVPTLQFAPTSDNITNNTQGLSANRPFFGDLNPTYCQRAIA